MGAAKVVSVPVTLVVSNLRAELRLSGVGSEAEIAARLLLYVAEAVSQHLGDAYATTPDAICNEAAIRLAMYAYDAPTAPMNDRYANAMRSSGAERLLMRYKKRGAGVEDAA